MPRTNLGRNVANEKIIALIWGAAAVNGLNNEQLCARVKLSPTTLHRRRVKPEDFTLGELRRIGRALNIPVEDLRAAIRY